MARDMKPRQVAEEALKRSPGALRQNARANKLAISEGQHLADIDCGSE
jgi:hypothetical protein